MANFGEKPGTCKAKPAGEFVRSVLTAVTNFDLGEVQRRIAQQQQKGAECWAEAIRKDMGGIEKTLKNNV